MPGLRTLLYVLQLALGIVLPLAVQLWDRRRLSPEQRARSWNTASWGAALYAFGPLSMLGWFWVTRRRAWALGVGLLVAAALMFVIWGITELAMMALGLPP